MGFHEGRHVPGSGDVLRICLWTKRDEIIRLQAERIAALERELAKVKMLLKEKADAKDAKKPIVAVSRFSR